MSCGLMANDGDVRRHAQVGHADATIATCWFEGEPVGAANVRPRLRDNNVYAAAAPSFSRAAAHSGLAQLHLRHGESCGTLARARARAGGDAP